jgi:hypothetical protein
MALKEFLSEYGTSMKDLPDCVCTYNGNLVICGDAACVWDDLERFGCRSGNGVAKDGWEFMTVNAIVSVFAGKVEHAYSNVAWVVRRHMRARRDDYRDEFGPPRYCHSRTEGTDYVWPWHGEGTSGLGAICTAIALGYDRVVLAGMPLENGPHNGEPPWRVTRFTREVEPNCLHWDRAINLLFAGKVKSMSGRTKEWLGEP